jgi:hypothetical protein
LEPLSGLKYKARLKSLATNKHASFEILAAKKVFDICDRKFTNANYLKSHMVVHERKKVSIL